MERIKKLFSNKKLMLLILTCILSIPGFVLGTLAGNNNIPPNSIKIRLNGNEPVTVHYRIEPNGTPVLPLGRGPFEKVLEQNGDYLLLPRAIDTRYQPGHELTQAYDEHTISVRGMKVNNINQVRLILNGTEIREGNRLNGCYLQWFSEGNLPGSIGFDFGLTCTTTNNQLVIEITNRPSPGGFFATAVGGFEADKPPTCYDFPPCSRPDCVYNFRVEWENTMGTEGSLIFRSEREEIYLDHHGSAPLTIFRNTNGVGFNRNDIEMGTFNYIEVIGTQLRVVFNTNEDFTHNANTRIISTTTSPTAGKGPIPGGVFGVFVSDFNNRAFLREQCLDE